MNSVLRIALVASVSFSALGCGDDECSGGADCAPPDASAQDGSADATTSDAEQDSSTPDSTTQPPDAQLDAAGDAEVPMCSFNRECPEEERCECVEDEGCYCTPGERGTGELNAPCEDGNDCASSVCLAGPDDETLCSIECSNEGECGGDLPLCQQILFVGMVCTRTPPE